ncbi:hypothetical protein GE21DRAFT_1309726 [Neurospora crassa]|nr:hypothetical protein GE21DRAFT_1309726 [Neurospora crassa]
MDAERSKKMKQRREQTENHSAWQRGQSCTQRSDPSRFTKIAGASERPQSTASLWRSLQVSRQRGCFALLYPCRYHFQWPCLFRGLREQRRRQRQLNDGSDSTCGDVPHPAANAKSAAGARFVLPPTLSVLLHMTKWNTSLPLGESCGKCQTSETLSLGAAALEARHWWTSPPCLSHRVLNRQRLPHSQAID